ncbi:hypothetical protein NMG60_11015729 [Bertholletia excelsa]
MENIVERERERLLKISSPKKFSYPTFHLEKIREENMSAMGILFRVDAICKKYEKFNIDDAFGQLYVAVESETESAIEKSEATNAEILRARAPKQDEIPKLQKLVVKKQRRFNLLQKGLHLWSLKLEAGQLQFLKQTVLSTGGIVKANSTAHNLLPKCIFSCIFAIYVLFFLFG